MERFYKAAPCTEEELQGGKYAYKKAKGQISTELFPERERDEDGFFIPAGFGAMKRYGLMCAVLGVTPANRRSDIYHGIDQLMKEAYEHEMRGLMCDVRLSEYQMLQKFAEEDYEAEQEKEQDITSKGAAAAQREGVTTVNSRDKRFYAAIVYTDEQRKLVNSVTWKYKWIQFYKKPCFLFAQYTIEELRDWNGMKRFLKTLSEDQQKFILDSEGAYSTKEKKCLYDTEAKSEDEKANRFYAGLYWRTVERHKERERFREDFIASYNKLPEANRRLMDVMYERAWNVISVYKYGKAPGHVPAPWYDRAKETGADQDSEEGDTAGKDTEGGDA